MFRKLVLVSALVLSLSGCGLVSVTDANHMEHGMMDDNNSQYSSNDLMFAQMMIPHHQQAIEMSNLAETRANNKEVLSLARTIKAEQAPEIEQMKSWLKAAGQSEMGMEDHLGMGMLTEEKITALEKAKGKEFEYLFLKGMIAHHKGAILMAETVTDSKNKEVSGFAKSVKETQSKEITMMQQLQVVVTQ